MKIKIEDMGFQYNEDAQVLHHIDLDLMVLVLFASLAQTVWENLH